MYYIVIFKIMKQATISFRANADQVKDIDLVAANLDRDRSYIINEAITAYLELYRWQISHIKEGIRQADAGEFASEEEIAKVFRRHSR